MKNNGMANRRNEKFGFRLNNKRGTNSPMNKTNNVMNKPWQTNTPTGLPHTEANQPADSITICTLNTTNAIALPTNIVAIN